MNMVTSFLEMLIDDAYCEDFIHSMDDIIIADKRVKLLLEETYSNADYNHLRAYAQSMRDRLYDEIGK